MNGEPDSSQVPIITGDICTTVISERFGDLKEKYVSLFECEPVAYIRVPGRVNLIGEHVDYCGYSVCPMAIQQEIRLAIGNSRNYFLNLRNSDDSIYSEFKCKDNNFRIDMAADGWVSYFLCGVKGALENLTKVPDGMNVLVSGNIPPGSGLSSSSALVCAAFIATNFLNKINLSKTEVASMSAVCERYIGTAGGGMDQAIAILGSKGCAKHIEFCPLTTKDVMLPSDAVFIIAHSCVIKNKAASADFNTRVVECRIAAQIMAKRNGLEWKQQLTLAGVQKALDMPLSKMLSIVEESLHEGSYTKQEVCELLEITQDEVNSICLTENTTHLEEFILKPRVMHVFKEALRVLEWCRLCREGCGVEALGRLMTESHVSLRDLYQCSHPKVDHLVSVCLQSGASGARLTGAGWGGCVVALTTKDLVDIFIKTVKENFYENNLENIDSLIFATSPTQGAEIFVPFMD